MTFNTGSSTQEHLRLNADEAELARLTAWLDDFCERHQIPEEAHYHLNIAVEELVLNAIKHGRCSPAQGAIGIGLSLSGPELDITITDTGIPFNPLNAPPPDLTSSLADRPIGGLGVHLVRSLMNSIEYKREGGENRLHLRKDFAGMTRAL
jgi:anti-sigma regulatory factor (Ser/Thr protein kinase)